MPPVTSSRVAATSAASRHHRSRRAPNQSGVRAVVKRGRQTDTRQHPTPPDLAPARVGDLGVRGGPQVSRSAHAKRWLSTALLTWG